MKPNVGFLAATLISIFGGSAALADNSHTGHLINLNPPANMGVLAYVCDLGSDGILDNPPDLSVTWQPIPHRFVLQVDGKGELTDSDLNYGCEFGGVTFTNIAGFTNFTSLSFQAKPQVECNNTFGPGVFINYTPAGSSIATTFQTGCGDLTPGAVSSDGFTSYTIPAGFSSFRGVAPSPGDRINSIVFAAFPDPFGYNGTGTDVGPIQLDSFAINGQLALKEAGGSRKKHIPQTCPTVVTDIEGPIAPCGQPIHGHAANALRGDKHN